MSVAVHGIKGDALEPGRDCGIVVLCERADGRSRATVISVSSRSRARQQAGEEPLQAAAATRTQAVVDDAEVEKDNRVAVNGERLEVLAPGLIKGTLFESAGAGLERSLELGRRLVGRLGRR